jgi:uncharacterized protein YkwD
VSRLRSGGAHAWKTVPEDARPPEATATYAAPPPADGAPPGTQPWPVWDRDTTAEQAAAHRGWRPGPIGIAVIVAAVLAAFGLGAAIVSPMFSGKPAGSAAGLTTNGPAGVAAPQPLVSDGPDAGASATPGDEPSPTAAATTAAPQQNTDAALLGFENAVVGLVNDERRRHHCDPVRNNGDLHTAARAHSQDMGANGKLDHDGSDGSSPQDRMRAAGYGKPLSENIAAGFRSPQQVMDGWMHSRSHRDNILDCDAKAVGVGLAIGRDGRAYWTQDFGR